MIRSFADLNSILIEPTEFEQYQYNNNNNNNDNNNNNNVNNDDDNYSDVDTYDYDDFEKDNDSVSRIIIKKDNAITNGNGHSASKRYVNNNDSNITNDSSDDIYSNVNTKRHEDVAELEELLDDDDITNTNTNNTNNDIGTDINRELFVKTSIDVIAIEGNNSTMNIVTNNDNNNYNDVIKSKIKTNTIANANTDWVNKVIDNIEKKATNTKAANTNTSDKHKDVYIVKAQNRKYYYSKVEPVDPSVGSSILQKANKNQNAITSNSNNNNNVTNSIDKSIKDILNNGDVNQEDLVAVVKSLLEKAITETNKKEVYITITNSL